MKTKTKPEPRLAVLFTDEEWGELTDAVDSHIAKLEALDNWEAVARRRAITAAFERLAESRRPVDR